ncbi:hypothetical protein SAMN05216559_3468 [Halomicrobium zhouii]|uniref:TraB family protein n=1 Tax=Halomicrobium zhouii TaxID=767519 RepID=A0A1I6LYZ7_9EURY|nr:hypothetical protein [Halomicrobium zhouii]SFS08608.1 hypothetical protein SAMN05216559_3468 [Halomicrobium zhouii]
MSDVPRRDPAALLADPRINSEQLRLYDDPDGCPVLVVGCVHDHPASTFRARALVESLRPDVVGVELPRLALPLFERVGRDANGDASTGGEMSAALAAAANTGADRTGIDTLGPRFARSLLSELRRESASLDTLERVLGSVSDVAGHALSCRLSAALGRFGTAAPVNDRANEHDIGRDATPSMQAEDEHRQLTRSLSVLRAFEQPLANDVVDAAREETMVASLADVRQRGSVVAVVGFDHLSGMTKLLDARGWTRYDPDAESLERFLH